MLNNLTGIPSLLSGDSLRKVDPLKGLKPEKSIVKEPFTEACTGLRNQSWWSITEWEVMISYRLKLQGQSCHWSQVVARAVAERKAATVEKQ